MSDYRWFLDIFIKSSSRLLNYPTVLKIKNRFKKFGRKSGLKAIFKKNTSRLHFLNKIIIVYSNVDRNKLDIFSNALLLSALRLIV